MEPQKTDVGRGRGRPAIGKGRKLGLRIRPELDDAIGRWMAAQDEPKLTKPEAIRRLLWAALRGELGSSK
jgi:hypothetical protein